MTWLKIDDGFGQHPKIVGLTDAAYRLHVNAMGHCAKYLTDGEVTEAALPTLYPRNLRKLTKELLDAGLWHTADHGCPACPDVLPGRFYVHGFLDYNPPADKVEADREAARERMRRVRSGRSSEEVRPNIERSSATPSRPDPSRANSRVETSLRLARAPGPVDDDDEGEARAQKVRAVFERWADQRMEGRKSIEDRGAYRRTVITELEGLHLGPLCALVDAHNLDAPLDSFILELEGKPNNLHRYPPKEATA